AYLAGCDGAHSRVRDGLGIGFPGGTYDHLFYVADVEARGAVMNGALHAALDTTDFLIVFPLKRDGHARLIGTMREEAERPHEQLSWDDVSKRVIEWIGIDVARVNWFSTYRVYHRVADHFRAGRAFLAGDAAHIHSPVGGQGMNTGIGDAVNLAWKLAAVVQQLIALCGARGLPLHVFSWRPTMARAGLTRNAAYLVRPDGYVALAEPEASAAKLKAYLDEWSVITAAVSSGRPANH